ncbi:hypothetical protein GCM10011487_57250 [Steroidobacter agaridevorans]|uniref:Condensation domain-containing protein n=2 Tax=Steroidobacter agaridevorans TaxID=2695856 RepID=A0A829YK85_9GAMM|nr:hypothetical protein GCM10011487_57250 [Steroidobacter agaridevorans]
MTFIATRVMGRLQASLVSDCLEEVVLRHEALRTIIVTRNGDPYQHITEGTPIRFSQIDVSNFSADAEDKVRKMGEEFVSERVDPAVGPLIVSRLYKLSNEDHVLVIAIDHIVTDGVSNGILVGEFWALYRQVAGGQAFSLPSPTLQFADYAVWQERIFESWLSKDGAYWKRRMNDAPRVRLPIEKQDVYLAGPGSAQLYIPIDASVRLQLRELARRQRTLAAMVVLSIYVVVMARWCELTDLVVGFTSDGRYRPELQSMIGPVAGPLYLRVQIAEDDTFVALLGRINREFGSAYEHYDFNRLPDIVPGLMTELHCGWLHSYRAQGLAHVTSEDLVITPFALNVTWPIKFGVGFFDGPGGLAVQIAYRTDCYSANTISWIGSNLRMFLALFTSYPSTRLSLVHLHAR